MLNSHNAVFNCGMVFCNDRLKFATVWKYFCALHCLGHLGKLEVLVDIVSDPVAQCRVQHTALGVWWYCRQAA